MLVNKFYLALKPMKKARQPISSVFE